MAVDYNQAFKQFTDGGGTDMNEFLKKHVQSTQTTPGPTAPPTQTPSPTPTPSNALGAAPVSPAPVASDSVTPAPAATAAALTPPPQPSPVVTPPPVPAPESTQQPNLDYSSGSNVVRQAQRVPDAPGVNTLGGAVAALPKPAQTAVGGTTAVRSPINSNNLYPPPDAIKRITGTPSSPSAASPAQSASAAPPAKRDAYDIGPYAEDSSGTFGSGWKPNAPAAAPAASTRSPSAANSNRVASAAEDDLPPGAAPYSAGPLANPKPTPPLRPTGQRLAGLPRVRSQRATSTERPKIFATAA